MDNTKLNSKVTDSYKTSIVFFILTLLLILCLIPALIYYDLKAQLEVDIDRSIAKVSERLNNKIDFYKATVINVAEKIEEKALINKPDLIHKLVLKSYQLLNQRNNRYETITIKVVGNYPNNYEVNELGVKKQSHKHWDNLSNFDAKGISLQINKNVDDYAKNMNVLKLCSLLQSASNVTFGGVCVFESLDDLFTSVKEHKDITTVEPVHLGSQEILNQKEFILTKSKPLENFSQVNIVGNVSYSAFKQKLYNMLFYPLLLILLLGCMSLLSLTLFYRRVQSENQNIIKFLSIFNAEYKAIRTYKDKIEKNLTKLLEQTKHQIGFIISNGKGANTAPNILNKIYRDLSTTYSINSEFPITTNTIKEAIDCFGETVLAKEIDIQFRINGNLNEVYIDNLFVQQVLCSVINELVTVLQPKGQITMELNVIENNNNKSLRILLEDNSFGIDTKKIEKNKSNTFLNLDEVMALVEHYGGYIHYENILYKGKKIEIKLDEKPKGLEDSTNVVKLY